MVYIAFKISLKLFFIELLLDLDQVNVIPSQRSTASPALITNPSGLAMNHSSLDHQFVRRNLQRQINSFAMMNPQQNRHDLSTSYFNPSEQCTYKFLKTKLNVYL